MANIAQVNHDRAQRLLDGDRAEIAETAAGLLDNAYHQVSGQLNHTRVQLGISQHQLRQTVNQLRRVEGVVVTVVGALVATAVENDELQRNLDQTRARIGVLEPLVAAAANQIAQNSQALREGQNLLNDAGHEIQTLRADLNAARQQLAQLERSCPVRVMTRVANLTEGVKNFVRENRVKIAFGVLAVAFAAIKSF